MFLFSLFRKVKPLHFVDLRDLFVENFVDLLAFVLLGVVFF